MSETNVKAPIELLIDVIDTKREKITDAKPAKIRLYDNKLTYLIQYYFTAIEDCDDVVKGEDGYRYVNCMVLKSKIESVHLNGGKGKLWSINVESQTASVCVLFADYNKAKAVRSAIEDWLSNDKTGNGEAES